ncbi:hypothetical protein BAUCODRAFT_74675 [Baudoinia panamericana UAMH 10762]|uniref:Inositol polyphosphate-related phosphatase domain-containing protein n=1 Tax=Baudoinia panamericana (strain UAMH 10762) TaxID=717646 RepID=M2LHY3_BAUPA|nr:uncharacterized protein BAUCODRAFT_74675 [Baudoinia panamericana UAMH 10762]EMC93792.1 hypothetical protein BAUCODRAFT_74675 [Baudoinia panamericana UAMH 10762]
MAHLNAYVVTFNCARQAIDVPYFAASLFKDITTELPPDLIVLCLQEVAPISYSFLGGSLLVPYLARFAVAVKDATAHKYGADSEYVEVAARNLGMTAIMVFARRQTKERIHWTQYAGTGVGLWRMGNKGAVGARFALRSADGGEDCLLTVIAAHLAPMEERWRRRNEDWRSICESLVFEDPLHSPVRSSKSDDDAQPLLSDVDDPIGQKKDGDAGTLFRPDTHVFFAGDLNYRTADTSPPTSTQSTPWPKPVEDTEDEHHYSHLLQHDQLGRERKAGRTLHNLTEAAPIKFPPTYKYSNAAQRKEWHWAQHRMPSWCDRILVLEALPPDVHSYVALPVQPTSDHRPVALYCTIPDEQVDSRVEPPFSIRQDWRDRRATARRLEIIVGLGAYLTMTWEGRTLLAGTIAGIVGGWLVLRALLGT